MFTKLKLKLEKEGSGIAGSSAGNESAPVVTDHRSSTPTCVDGLEGRGRRLSSVSSAAEEVSPTIHQSAHISAADGTAAPRLMKKRASTSSDSESFRIKQLNEDSQISKIVDASPAAVAAAMGSSSKEELLEMLVKRTGQVKQLDNRLTELSGMIKDKNQTIEKLETALEKQQDVLCQRVQELNEQYHGSRAKMSENITAAVRQKEQEMKGKIEELERNLAKAQEELKRFKTEGGSSDTQETVIDERVNEAEKRMKEYEKKNKELLEDVSRLKKENQGLEKQLKASKDAFAKMAQQNNEDDWLEKQIESERTLSALDDDIRKLKTELSQKDGEKSSLVRQLSEKVSELSEAKKTILTLESNLKTSKSELSEVQQTVEMCRLQCSKLEQEKGLSDSCAAELKAECESCRTELTQCRSESAVELEERDKAIRALTESSDSLQSLIDTLQAQLAELSEEKRAAGMEVEAVEKLKQQVAELETQLLEKNKTIKKQELRLTDMRKLFQRELKGGPQIDSTSSSSLFSANSSSALEAFDNGASNSSRDTLTELARNSHATSGIKSSESYPNLSHGGSAAHRSELAGDRSSRDIGVAASSSDTAATLNVSYSVSQHSTMYNGQASVHSTARFAPDAYPSSLSDSDPQRNAGMFQGMNYNNDESKVGREGAELRGLSADDIAELLDSASVGRGKNSSRGARSRNEDYDLTRELNFKYLRHVILKFMLSRESEALQLLKALSMLLHFTAEEQKLLKDTLEWKMSWFGAKPQVPDKGQLAKVIPP